MATKIRLAALCVLCGALSLASPSLRAQAAEPTRQATGEANIALLLEMCRTGNLKEIKALLDQGADPNARATLTISGRSWEGDALSAAVESRRIAVVDYLISRGARLSVLAYNAAIRSGQRTLAGDMKAKGAAPFSEEIVAAAARGDGPAILALIRKGADPNSMSWMGETALAAAASHGSLESVIILLENGAMVSDTDSWGKTAIDLTETTGDPRIAKLLRTVGSDTRTFLSRVALGEAVVKKDAGKVAKLLSQESDPNLGYESWDDASHFFDRKPPRLVDVACALGSAEIVKAFIAKGANVGKYSDGLFYAAGTGRLDIVGLLLDARAKDPAVGSADSAALLNYAIGLKDLKLVDLIVAKAGEAIAASPEGMAALIDAAGFIDPPGSGSVAAARLLAAHGIADAPQDQKDDALRSALRAGNSTWARILLSKGAQLRSGGAGWAPLALAVRADAELDLIEELIAKGAEVNDLGSEMSALNVAAWHQRPDVVKFLLEHGADPNLPEPGMDTPLMEALRGGSLDIIRMLLAAGANPNAKCSFFNGHRSTALMQAAEYADLEKISLILSSSPKVALTDTTGRTAIDYLLDASAWNADIALSLAKLYKAKPLTDSKADARLRLILSLMSGDYETAGAIVAEGVGFEAENADKTMLMCFAAHGDIATVKFLLSRGADPLRMDGGNPTAAVHAAANGYSDLVKLLLPSRTVDPKQGERAMAAAAAGGHTKVVEYLLGQGFSVDSTDDKGSPALMLAAQAGKKDVVQLLLKKGAKIDAVSPAFHWTNTPLACAAQNGDADMVKLLLGAGANAAVGNGDALISALPYEPHLDTAKLILGRMTTPQRKAACSRAIKEIPVPTMETIRLLLDNGGVPDGGVLTKALEYHDRELALFLLERGAPANVLSSEGYTPLRLALESMGPEMVDRLMAKGADPLGLFVPVGVWPSGREVEPEPESKYEEM